jgi:hypothetical protein
MPDEADIMAGIATDATGIATGISSLQSGLETPDVALNLRKQGDSVVSVVHSLDKVCKKLGICQPEEVCLACGGSQLDCIVSSAGGVASRKVASSLLPLAAAVTRPLRDAATAQLAKTKMMYTTCVCQLGLHIG